MSFLAVFFLMFVLSYGVLYAIDFIPEAPKDDEKQVTVIPIKKPTVVAPAPIVVSDPYPQRLLIDVLGKNIVIQNPKGRAVAELDKALLTGAVRHPDSADFKNTGNMFLFGH